MCVASSDNSSYIYQYPTETKYSKTSNCTGLSSTSKVYNPLCSIVEVGDDFFTSTVLSYTNSGLMYTTPTQQPTASPFFPSGTNSNNDDVSLTDGAIAGIAIGGFVFFAAIITVIYCFACKKATLGEKKEEKDFLSSVF